MLLAGAVGVGVELEKEKDFMKDWVLVLFRMVLLVCKTNPFPLLKDSLPEEAGPFALDQMEEVVSPLLEILLLLTILALKVGRPLSDMSRAAEGCAIIEGLELGEVLKSS